MSDYRVVMLGGAYVGKSSITVYFLKNTFVDRYDPTIEGMFVCMIMFE